MCRLCSVKWYPEWCQGISAKVRLCSRMPHIWRRCQLTKLLSCHPASATLSTAVSVSSSTRATIIWAAENRYHLTCTTNSMVDEMLAVCLQNCGCRSWIFKLFPSFDDRRVSTIGTKPFYYCFYTMWFFFIFHFCVIVFENCIDLVHISSVWIYFFIGIYIP